MRIASALRFCAVVLVSALPLAAQAQQKEQPSAGCPPHPNTLRVMRTCYRPLVVFAPSMNDPQLLQEFNLLKAQAAEMNTRDVIYTPVVPEGHNQPIPKSALRTASLSEDELAAVRDHYHVAPDDFVVILIGKDGGEKLTSHTPLTVSQLKQTIDSMPMRKHEVKQ